MTTVLIIEDEKASSDHLIQLLKESKWTVSILEVLISVDESLEWLRNNEAPDLIFMDIQLSDGKSFEIFNSFKIQSPVVFVTAYDEYAIPAFKTTGIDYLLKPINNLDLDHAITKYFENKILMYNQIGQNMNALVGTTLDTGYKERFLVSEGSHLIPVNTKDIAYFYRSEIVFLRLFDGRSYAVNQSLNNLEELLPPDIFLRINRAIVANINSIKQLVRVKPGIYAVSLQPNFHEEIILSQEKSKVLRGYLS